MKIGRKSARALAIAALLATTAGTLAACNTVAGAGKDVSAAGKATTNAADNVKNGN